MTISVGPIKTTNPSLYDAMLSCYLKAGFMKTPGISEYILGSPRAWLGSAYHKVMEIAGSRASRDLSTAEILELWLQSVNNYYKHAIAHPLDHRYGRPESWPGYFIVFYSLIARIKNLPQTPRRSNASCHQSGDGFFGTIPENDFFAFGSRLRGQPDVIEGNTIIDYKSGAIFEAEQGSLSNVVKEAYIRQIKIYAYLVKENLGYWPSKGILLPSAGGSVEISLDPAECEQEANNAVNVLASYNSKLNKCNSPTQIASPSAMACKWCSFQQLCAAFWSADFADWEERLGMVALEGSLSGDPELSFNLLAYKLLINLAKGPPNITFLSIANLDRDVFSNVGLYKNMDFVRITGLQRIKGELITSTMRTVIFCKKELPEVRIIGNQL